MALRKPESELPMLPTERPAGHIQCAADATCRKPGRIDPTLEGLTGFNPKDRICVDHLYIAIDRNRHPIKA